MKIRQVTSRSSHSGQKLLQLGFVILSMFLVGCSNSKDDLIPITTSSDQAREYFRPGRDLDERLRPLEACHYYEKAITLDSNFALAYLYLASTKSNMDDQLRLVNRALALAGKVSEGEALMIRAAQVRLAGNRLAEGDYYHRLATQYPNDERAHNLLGDYCLSVHMWERAVEEYQKAVKINADYAPAYNGLGYAYSRLGKFADAENAFLKYIALIPNDPNPYDSYAELLLRQGRFSESLVYYQEALQKNPYFFPAYGGVASVYSYMGQYGEARIQLGTLYERARTADQQRLACYGWAISYADEGYLDSAIAYMKKSYALAKEASDVSAMATDLNTMGDILLECRKSDEALKEYQQAAKLVEQSSLARMIKETFQHMYLYQATRVAISTGDLATAKGLAAQYCNQAATTNDPLCAELSHELAGTIALAEKDYPTALTELQKADVLNPYNLYRLAQVYRGLGDRQKSEEMARQVMTFYVDNSLAHVLVRGKAKECLAAIQSD